MFRLARRRDTTASWPNRRPCLATADARHQQAGRGCPLPSGLGTFAWQGAMSGGDQLLDQLPLPLLVLCCTALWAPPFA
jgi:hypothetical protein